MQSLQKINLKDTNPKRITLSFFFILAFIFSLNQTLDDSSKHYVDKAFNRALISFGVAKTLNGVISVAQGTEVAIQPAGVGVNFTPGQILDPINDLVERFSWVMLASSTSLGIQKIFLTMSIWPAFNYVLIFFILFGLFLIFIETKKYFHMRILFLRITLLFIVLRFAVPITALANESIYHVFLENEYVTSTQNLEQTAQQIGQLNEIEQNLSTDEKKNTLWDDAKEIYKSTADILNINKKIKQYKLAAKETTYHIVNLIVVFLFQTLIIPLAFIFMLYIAFKYIVKLKFEF